MNSCRKAGSTSIADPTHGATNASAVPPGQSPADCAEAKAAPLLPPKEKGNATLSGAAAPRRRSLRH